MLAKLKHTLLFSLSLLFSSTLFAVNPSSTTYAEEYGGSGSGSGSSGQTYTVGEYAQGGVIFWLHPDLQHGLVASIVDLEGPAGSTNTIPWSPGATVNTIGATGSDLSFGANYTTTGKINSQLIYAKYGASNNYAVGVCSAYTGGGYTDWYLPSRAELGLMMSMQSTINSTSLANGGNALQLNIYWSSLEYNTNQAWYQDFSSASQSTNNKTTSYLVRAVRAF